MKLSELRKKYLLTQKELAILFNIPLRTIQNWEYRDCCPDYIVALISKLLGRFTPEQLRFEVDRIKQAKEIAP